VESRDAVIDDVDDDDDDNVERDVMRDQALR
jgi:hypothetical protein